MSNATESNERRARDCFLTHPHTGTKAQPLRTRLTLTTKARIRAPRLHIHQNTHDGHTTPRRPSETETETESVDVTPTAELLAAMRAPPAKQQPLPQEAPNSPETIPCPTASPMASEPRQTQARARQLQVELHSRSWPVAIRGMASLPAMVVCGLVARTLPRHCGAHGRRYLSVVASGGTQNWAGRQYPVNGGRQSYPSVTTGERLVCRLSMCTRAMHSDAGGWFQCLTSLTSPACCHGLSAPR